MPPLAEIVSEFRRTTEGRRTELLQRYIGSQDADANELHRRALLVTALREAELWPPGIRNH